MIEELLNRKIVKYTVYNVTRLKDKYGFRILLIFNNGDKETQQIGGFSKKKEATDERDEVISDLKNNRYVIYPKIKVKDYFDYWLEKIMKPNIKYNSYMSYRNVINNYIIKIFNNLYISQLNMGHIQKLYNEIAEQHHSIARLSKTIMKTSLSYAKQKNLIKLNPAEEINLPKQVEVKKNKIIKIDTDKALTIEQIKTLIAASKETPIYLQILFAVLMGLRKQEINGLKYSDIDYVNRKLYIQRQLGVDPNKSKEDCKKKTYTKQEIKLKSYSSERTIDIPDIVFDAILEERQKYERNRKKRINDKTCPFVDSNYICCSTYGHSRSKAFHRKYFIKILEENNLPKIRFHDLRHTFATLLLMNNYNLKAISEMLGHATTIITANVYFDKNKIIVDCNEELNNYMNEVCPKSDKQDKNSVLDLDTNLIVNEFLCN